MKPKKHGSIAVSQVNNKKLYNKLYYDLKIRPYRKNKDPIFLFQDVFSGMLITKKQLQKPINQSKILLREGCNYLNPFSIDKYKQEAEEEMKSYFKITTWKSLEYLDLAIVRGYITKEKVADYFDIEKIGQVSESVKVFASKEPRIESRELSREDPRAFVRIDHKAQVI